MQTYGLRHALLAAVAALSLLTAHAASTAPVAAENGMVVTAQHLARRLQAGSNWISDWHDILMDAPFGGSKESGCGREFGVAGRENFLETKTVVTAFQRNPGVKMLYGMLHKQSA